VWERFRVDLISAPFRRILRKSFRRAVFLSIYTGNRSWPPFLIMAPIPWQVVRRETLVLSHAPILHPTGGSIRLLGRTNWPPLHASGCVGVLSWVEYTKLYWIGMRQLERKGISIRL
jgi:hypothetical protein